ncbi:hypothetical protein BT67DRAFT_77019 [Trichocladium antarcticum]|uniref:Secreted protein n=1 Tax=Trichocladium antarcticum TaxID=1450529 RepID=A0AAN6UJB7_9PEZI|nr:hypothetical protein BT67DRAFT_77019 [Trichocladium antarcticum]
MSSFCFILPATAGFALHFPVQPASGAEWPVDLGCRWVIVTPPRLQGASSTTCDSPPPPPPPTSPPSIAALLPTAAMVQSLISGRPKLAM